MKSPAPKQPQLPHPSLKHPGRWLWLILAVPIVLGLTRLHFDVEVFDLLPGNLTTVQGLKLYQEHFANARELIVTLQGADAEQTEAAAQAMAERLRQHTDVVATVTWQPPWLEHPEQAAELMGYLWFNQPPDSFRELAHRLAPPNLPEVLSNAREELSSSLSPQEIARLSYDPFGLTRLPESAAGAAPSFGQGQESFSSSDGTFRIVFVQARANLHTYKECQKFLDAVKAVVSEALSASRSNVKTGYTGRPAFVAEVAAGMEHDITISVGGTAVIIALLFYLAHRRVKPMLWLLTLLAAILGSTLALGGLIFGTINVVSMGFAAILLGLAVDYAVVHYQEALAHPNLTVPQIRHAIAPSIFWAATTTITAFVVLNFGGLPGLGQLGTLVALGVALAATIMIFEFLPPLFPGRNEGAVLETPQLTAPAAEPTTYAPATAPTWVRSAAMLSVTAVVVVLTLAVLVIAGIPKIDPTANALRPRHSPAYEAVDQITAHLNQKKEPLWLIIGGKTVTNVEERLQQAQAVLNRAVSNNLIAGFTLPTPLWPRPDYQAQNRETARQLASEGPIFWQAALTNGFSTNALALTDRVLDTWQRASASTDTFWPTNPMSQWIFNKLAARTPTNDFALGLINPLTDASTKVSSLAILETELPHHETWLSGWELLGSAIFTRVQANMWKVVAPMAVLVLLSLYLAFRRPPEILLSLAVLGLSGLCLLTVMKFAGWAWNLLNLMGIPLVLGTGVDYSIFMLLALRRFHGDLGMAYNAVGRALLLCGATAVAGFGSLSLSTNAGMASLGQVCAVGIGSNMLLAIFLLPIWWYQVERRRLRRVNSAEVRAPSAPSSLYRSEFWRVGLLLVRVLPTGVAAGLSRLLVGSYYLLAGHRREVVVQNLLPALGGDRETAQAAAKDLFQNFGRKLVDLWRFEAGLPIDHLFGQTTGWEYFQQAQAEKRGILLLTPHLGNWEFGGPLLTGRGVTLQVLTLAEPGEEFTKLRQQSRARWKIETLVVRNDPLAFVEVIRRLEEGATVALLMDRPPPATAVNVKLFGRQFPASIAAAELARASGCVLLPVYLPRRGEHYEAHILPPISYDRQSLRDRGARQELTQRIMAAFEPTIRQHLDQWYHFVPIWPNQC